MSYRSKGNRRRLDHHAVGRVSDCTGNRIGGCLLLPSLALPPAEGIVDLDRLRA